MPFLAISHLIKFLEYSGGMGKSIDGQYSSGQLLVMQ